jgi:uncharacterized membrane protein YvbJ
MKFCPECGSKIEGKAKFCSNCGTSIGPEIQELQEVARPKEVVKPIVKEQPKSEPSNQLLAEVSASVRVTPVYGAGFKRGVHCLNCGSKTSNARNCQVCGVDQ